MWYWLRPAAGQGRKGGAAEDPEHRSEMRNHQRKYPSERGVGVLDCGNIAANYSLLMSALSFFHLVARTAGTVCQALDSVNSGISRIIE